MRNIGHVIKKTAADLGLPEEKVRPIVEKYWSEVYGKVVKEMKPDCTSVFLRNIGVFTISKYKLNNHIAKKIAKIKGMKLSTKYSDSIKKEYIEKQMERLKKALVHRNIIAKEYAEKFGNI